MRWYRWTVVTVGRYSGNRRSLPFIRFRHLSDAMNWCVKMNNALNEGGGSGIYHEVERIP